MDLSEVSLWTAISTGFHYGAVIVLAIVGYVAPFGIAATVIYFVVRCMKRRRFGKWLERINTKMEKRI